MNRSGLILEKHQFENGRRPASKYGSALRLSSQAPPAEEREGIGLP
jgi:hypothetical protein